MSIINKYKRSENWGVMRTNYLRLITVSWRQAAVIFLFAFPTTWYLSSFVVCYYQFALISNQNQSNLLLVFLSIFIYLTEIHFHSYLSLSPSSLTWCSIFASYRGIFLIKLSSLIESSINCPKYSAYAHLDLYNTCRFCFHFPPIFCTPPAI